MTSKVFFPQTMLGLLVDAERMDLEGEQLVLTEGGCRYEVQEGVRIVREVTTGEDPHDLCGKVKLKGELDAMGAELLSDSMIYEDNGYEVVSGFIGTPVGEGPGAHDEHELLAELTADL